ncbi:lysine--tRNA ligase [Fluviispira multicolorata]|uniref:Lysine--tRNA ligase n=1 Tax=Fluviispira multicolorata TaxID=2654512 RepID=A0A833N2S6_9BACT|nr:lysine--tRNA ligase [Fluviispira multicolorata]KAB8033248.1 lysine--tRNA ligase [Fluviispira multicolorata]
MSDNIFELKKTKFLEQRENNNLADYYNKTHTVEQVASLKEGAKGISTAGRIVAMRTMGKILFAHIYDFSGKVQICVRKTEDAPEVFENFVAHVSIGDFIGAEGEMFVTKTGELTLRVGSWQLLNKCLRTLPEKYHGIEDIETRYRQRYLDIIMNQESRDVFKKRFEIVKTIRRYLEDSGYLEVETPILQTTPSGALARPFFTHHNALDIECVMRIACETYLKRCIGAGMDKVFEFARSFRNEGISATHLQDFTMLEFYASYWNSDTMRKFVEGMMRDLIEKIFGSVKVTLSGKEIDFSGEWPVHEYSDLVKKDSGIDITKYTTRESLSEQIKAKNIRLDDDIQSLSWANMVDSLYKKVSRPKLIQPCFLIKYPVEMAPLARRNSKNSNYVDFFQFLVNGVELVKAYSELVDPLDQRERFEEQMQAREHGDDEAMPIDEEYLTAMEHGFPPIAGVGIGIDRLTMILCGCENIKDTILFPLLRPHSHSQEEKAPEKPVK